MLAERLVTVLPPLSREQALETHAIRSLTGQVGEVVELDRTPPFVAPHHSASVAAVAGGGSGVALPGAISRAHHGVLFLDEAPEFKGSVLQTLRQPLESGEVVIARARQVVRYPARFLLVLAANPCPCGRSYGKGLDCTCKPMEIRSYAGRLSGPLLDRVDLQVHVPPVQRAAFGDETGEPSAAVAARVASARAGPAAPVGRRWLDHQRARARTRAAPATVPPAVGHDRRARPQPSNGTADPARLRPGAAGRVVRGRPGRARGARRDEVATGLALRSGELVAA